MYPIITLGIAAVLFAIAFGIVVVSLKFMFTGCV
jgi:hypothetical protein